MKKATLNINVRKICLVWLRAKSGPKLKIKFSPKSVPEEKIAITT
jgi:hypothetical protein